MKMSQTKNVPQDDDPQDTSSVWERNNVCGIKNRKSNYILALQQLLTYV